ncbi:MAG TPA: hypothetical protein VGO68_08155 [Pyrinomonadaceae bacterium]|nr:hypothetical protein [Pyrinomonadaceae bacterium]
MRLLSSIRVVRVALALAVAFWMAGAGCLLGCEQMINASAATTVTSPASPTIIVASGSACAAMRSSHNCCAKRGGQRTSKPSVNPGAKATWEKAQSVEAVPVSMMDCPLAVTATAALAKAGSDQASAAVPDSSATIALVNSAEQTSAFARPLRLPNRGHTYLRCCVFLI